MSPAAVAVLARVRAAGAELQADGDNLRWRAPEPLPSDLLESMKARKDELLESAFGEVRETEEQYAEGLITVGGRSPADGLNTVIDTYRNWMVGTAEGPITVGDPGAAEGLSTVIARGAADGLTTVNTLFRTGRALCRPKCRG